MSWSCCHSVAAGLSSAIRASALSSSGAATRFLSSLPGVRRQCRRWLAHSGTVRAGVTFDGRDAEQGSLSSGPTHGIGELVLCSRVRRRLCECPV
jgi:hypothetical protein